MSKKYREFHYHYHPSNEPSQALPETYIKYIVDKEDNIMYYDLNQSGWISTSNAKLTNDAHKILIRHLSHKELEQEIFVENI